MSPAMTSPADKILGRHRDRLAIVYVRQSTLQQLERHQESTRLQYALVGRAEQFGWARERIVVIDNDLGRSGASVEGRPGFQRLVAEVGLGHVGLVLGIEVSRLARSCRDWHQLLEICALRDCLIADADGVYNPSTYNDRLLLGLKGTLSEAELHLIKGRMQAGRQAKAERGEMIIGLPRGYVWRPPGQVALDPDEQVQATIHLVFDLFDRRGSVHGVLQYFRAHHLKLPCRLRGGQGELEWHVPSRTTLQDMLHNPAYAGAYAHGRHAHRARRPDRPMILLKDRWPAYISWDSYERNQERMAANRNPATSVARGGPALLAGLVVCGSCGRRLTTAYQGTVPRYRCSQAHLRFGAPYCQSLGSRELDALVAGLILRALEPAAVEITLQLSEEVELERQQLHRQWRQRLERARYEADRARRQYQAVEPENRLVARSLERDWESLLAAEAVLQRDHQAFLDHQPMPLGDVERQQLRQLAQDVPALWQGATPAQRQAIAKLMLEQVVVTVAGDTDAVAVTCHWAGGVRTRHALSRTVRRFEQLSGYPALMERVRVLHQAGHKPPAIAVMLNAEGWHPPKRRLSFTPHAVLTLLHRQGVPSAPYPCPSDRVERQGPHEKTVKELAACLQMPVNTLYHWLYRGDLQVRRVTTAGHCILLVEADAAEIERLAALRIASRQLPPSIQ